MGSNSSGCGHTGDLDRGVKCFSVRIISTRGLRNMSLRQEQQGREDTGKMGYGNVTSIGGIKGYKGKLVRYRNV